MLRILLKATSVRTCTAGERALKEERKRTGSFGGTGRAVRRRAARERSEDVRSACADGNCRRVGRRGSRRAGLTGRVTDQPAGVAAAETSSVTHLQCRDPVGARRSRVSVRDIVRDLCGERHQALHFREAAIAAPAAVEGLSPVKRVCLSHRSCQVARVSSMFL